MAEQKVYTVECSHCHSATAIPNDAAEAIAAAIREAVAAETERCARIADSDAEVWERLRDCGDESQNTDVRRGQASVARGIAACIRSNTESDR